MKGPYLVAYDITSPRRLGRVSRFLKQWGIRLQYSVFWVELTWPQLQRMKIGLEELINPDEDDVRIYPLPGAPKVTLIGRAKPFPPGVQVFFEQSSSDWLLRKRSAAFEEFENVDKKEGDQ